MAMPSCPKVSSMSAAVPPVVASTPSGRSAASIASVAAWVAVETSSPSGVRETVTVSRLSRVEIEGRESCSETSATSVSGIMPSSWMSRSSSRVPMASPCST